MKYAINLFWDNEASVWVATSENIHGLTLEANSINILIERVKFVVPELLRLNQGFVQPSIFLRFYFEIEIQTNKSAH